MESPTSEPAAGEAEPTAGEALGSRGRRRRRWRRRLAVVAILLSIYGLLCVRDVRLATAPVDAVINLLPTPEPRPEWRPEVPTLVVLQHGLSRSSWALWRLERALREHGYEVLNPGYASTDGRLIEDYASDLHRRLSDHLAARSGQAPRLCMVGHSMGGLVIRAAMTREDFPEPDAVVFLGVPQRGAHLAIERRDGLPFQLFLGDGAPLQLVPGDPFYDRLGPIPARSIGVLYGHAGDSEGFNDDIPGDDDRTVAVSETVLPEATATRGLKIGHFRLGFDASVIQEVHGFLATGSFGHAR